MSTLTLMDAQVSVEGCAPERAERITRLIFERVEQRLAEMPRHHISPRSMLTIPPVEVDWEGMGDTAIAERGADAILSGLEEA